MAKINACKTKSNLITLSLFAYGLCLCVWLCASHYMMGEFSKRSGVIAFAFMYAKYSFIYSTNLKLVSMCVYIYVCLYVLRMFSTINFKFCGIFEIVECELLKFIGWRQKFQLLRKTCINIPWNFPLPSTIGYKATTENLASVFVKNSAWNWIRFNTIQYDACHKYMQFKWSFWNEKQYYQYNEI